jgi:potassium-transporting ATPase KdpC subunit
MNSDFFSGLRPAIVLTILLTILTCGIYPLAVMGIGKVAFAHQANGSLIVDNGVVTGSELIGQSFTSDKYFNSRPSAAGKGYDGTASSGSNLGPTSKALVDRMKGDIAKYQKMNPGQPIPADLVTASASGLDPDISPAAALFQVPHLAKVRGIPEARLTALVNASVSTSILPFLGDPHVNVLALNRQLDQLSAHPAQ